MVAHEKACFGLKTGRAQVSGRVEGICPNGMTYLVVIVAGTYMCMKTGVTYPSITRRNKSDVSL